MSSNNVYKIKYLIYINWCDIPEIKFVETQRGTKLYSMQLAIHRRNLFRMDRDTKILISLNVR